MGFEPTDGFTRQTISSRSRYDLFDTAPYEIRGRKRPENQSAAKCRKSVEIIKHREKRKREFPKSHGDFRSSAEKKSTRFRVKVGTSTLTNELGQSDLRSFDRLACVLSDVRNMGYEVILVSSGAIAVGANKLKMKRHPTSMRHKQAAAAVGQCSIMFLYDKFFCRAISAGKCPINIRLYTPHH